MVIPQGQKKVSSDELRGKFNSPEVQESIRTGKLRRRDEKAHEPNPAYNQPPGTRSVIGRYLNDFGIEIFRVHMYVNPDGSLGASRKEDPKRYFDLKSRTLYYDP